MNYVSSLARLTGFCVLLGMGGLAQAHHPAYELARGDGSAICYYVQPALQSQPGKRDFLLIVQTAIASPTTS